MNTHLDELSINFVMKKQTNMPATLRWSLESLWFYRWRHLIFVLTAALSAAILSAALSAGDSLQAGLQRDLRLRLGNTRSAVILTEGLFPASLAERLGESEASLLLRGEMLDANGVVCADKVNILGVPEYGTTAAAAPGSVGVNSRAAEIVDSFGSDRWSYRFEKPSLFPVELPLGSVAAQRMERRTVSGVRPVIAALITPDFDPSPATVLPINIQLPYADLAAQADVEGMVNILLSCKSPAELTAALQRSLTTADIGLQIDFINGLSAVKSSRVFLPDDFCRALTASGAVCQWANFQLADEFASASGASTPYSFVGAITPDNTLLPVGMRDNQIVINTWLADTLSLKLGDELTMHWRRFEAGGELVAKTQVFEVCKILTMEQAAAVKQLMPELPGLAGVDSCADWNIGLPMDEEKLEDPANETYWKGWRETPKALITFAAGKDLFSSYFGEAMSVRVQAKPDFIEDLLREIDPARLGFNVRPLWQEGVAAALGSTDFRGLFVGMAFILMISALILAGLSLSLALDARKLEPALFSALGLSRVRVVTMISVEWVPAIACGAIAGSFAGSLLARALIWSLSRFWSEAVAGARLAFYFSWQAVLLSALITFVLLSLMLLRRVYKFSASPPVEIMRQSGVLLMEEPGRIATLIRRVAGPLCAAGAVVVIVLSRTSVETNGAFFGAGFLLMISMLFFIKGGAELWFASLSARQRVVGDPFKSGVVQALHSGARGRSLTILLATGVFLTVGMLAMKHDPAAGSELSSSGSGGFASIMYSTLPQTLADGIDMARRVTGSNEVVPIRVRDGDEAGCMNMSVPQVPRLYALSVSQMAGLRAFEPDGAGGIWSTIYDQPEEGVIPALAADQAMLQYSLKMKAGDEITYPGSDGRLWRIRIVGTLPVRVSVLQGGLILNEEHFLKMFPMEGYRLWLCDYAPYQLRVAASLKHRYPEPGIRVETTVERLRVLGRMEASYLDMFLVLGALGLALGIIGVILVIVRSVEERCYEFAVMQAVGLKKQAILLLVLTEYGALIMTGLLSGLIPAIIAIQPAARALYSAPSWGLIGGVVLALTLSAVFAVITGTFYALRGFDVSLLKRE
ncbi:MAG: ABC transporter permease [Kiritimatiellia bacterium]